MNRARINITVHDHPATPDCHAFRVIRLAIIRRQTLIVSQYFPSNARVPAVWSGYLWQDSRHQCLPASMCQRVVEQALRGLDFSRVGMRAAA